MIGCVDEQHNKSNNWKCKEYSPNHSLFLVLFFYAPNEHYKSNENKKYDKFTNDLADHDQSIVTFFILWGVTGLSAESVGTAAISSTTSIPSTTLPKAAY